MHSRSLPRAPVVGALACAIGAFVAAVIGCSGPGSAQRSPGASSGVNGGSTTAITSGVTPPAASTKAPTTPSRDTTGAVAGDSLRASIAGVGAVRFGTTVDAAARAAGGTAAHPPEGSCGFVSFRGLPRGVRFMVSYDTVVRADVDSASIPTDAGARVGMTEDSVQHLYGGHLGVTPHKYVRGAHYLTLVPGAAGDTLRRIIFETDGKRVTRYRAGVLPYVANVEGCG